MRLTFYEWCSTKRCNECRYEHLSTAIECREAYENDAENDAEISCGDLKTIEKKLDAIIRHFNISID